MIKRLIPQLLIKNKKLVKTKGFRDYKYVGDPINAIKIFNEKEVDELIITDISTFRDSKIDFDFLSQLTEEAFMPLTYGGGIRSLEDVSILIKLGIEKVCLHDQIFNNFQLIHEIIKKFGSQALVANINVKESNGEFLMYNATRNEVLDNMSLKEHLKKLSEIGVGELLVIDVQRDGFMNGLNQSLIKYARENINQPLIISGGCSSLSDVDLAFKSGADAVAAGAYFVFYGPHDAVLITYPKRSNIDKIAIAS